MFPHDPQYHRVRLSADRTLCGLATKGRVRGVAERQPPALVTPHRPMLSSHTACPECDASAPEKSGSKEAPLAHQTLTDCRHASGAE